MPYATVRIAPQWALVLTEWARQALGQELSRVRIAAALPTHDNTSRRPPSFELLGSPDCLGFDTSLIVQGCGGRTNWEK